MIGKLKQLIMRGAQPQNNIDLLVDRGLQLGKNVSIQNDVIIDPSHCWLISIGDECTLAPRVIILAHDASTKRHIKYTKIGRVKIGNKTFVGAGSIILPGVSIGRDVVIGAGSVVSKDIPDGVVVAGNPARIICTIDKYIAKHSKNQYIRPVFEWKGWTLGGGITDERKNLMQQQLDDGIGYVE
jgi:maltose O-acetyltransferase